LIKVVLFDIDGVVTDGTVWLDQDGREIKRMSMVDIDAIHDLHRHGFILGAITGETEEKCLFFRKRFHWDYFYSGVKDKLDVLNKIRKQEQVDPSEICYIGDGWYDVQPLKNVGLSVCPKNAIPEVLEVADVCLSKSGGDGCLWELRRLLLEYNEKGV